MGERRWFQKRKDFVFRVKGPEVVAEDEERPDWTRCPDCEELTYNETLADSLMVCPCCGFHGKIDAITRLERLCDPGSLVFHDSHLRSVDALDFVDSKPYTQRITESGAKTGRNDAFVSVSASIEDIQVEVGCFDFRYMGGSMGSVVGEMITRLFERGTAAQRPCIVISASGGARMQEGVLSLMQMAKTSAALARLKEDAKMPYISVLTHPTTGGVAASFAMLGDLIFAEPEALIGFAGARVIKQTIGQDLPEGFQRSEYLLDHGMVDAIVTRGALRGTLAQVMRQLLKQPAPMQRLLSEELMVGSEGA